MRVQIPLKAYPLRPRVGNKKDADIRGELWVAIKADITVVRGEFVLWFR